MSPASAWTTDKLVAFHSDKVVDDATYDLACDAIDALVSAGQCTKDVGKAAKRQLLTMAIDKAAAAKAAASKSDGKPTMKVTPGGMVGFGRSAPGANQQYGLSLFPKTLQWLFEHREVIEQFIAANSGELSWTKADAERFAERKAKAKAEYEAKKAAAAKA